jgi:hypothetical protein
MDAGLSRSISSVPVADPGMETPGTAPASQSTTVQPVRASKFVE